MQELFAVLIQWIIQLGTVFGVGLYIATSPCLFPLLPLFLIRNLQSEYGRTRSILVTGILTAGILASLGAFTPYLAIALVTGESRDRLASKMAESARSVEIVVGCLLIALGVWLILLHFGFYL